jgi:predicted SprT family Zn-dependent metalloprotease
MKTNTLLTIALCLGALSTFAQGYYTAAPTAPADSISYLQRWEANRQMALQLAPEEHIEHYQEVFDNRYDYLTESLREGHFLFHPSLQAFLDSLVQVIVAANPGLAKQSMEVLVGRYDTPNAVSLGDGTFIFNIGLLRKLQHSDQLTFVLCHEIAHLQLQHLESRLARKAKYAENDKGRQRAWRKAAKKGETNELANQLQADLYGERRHSRQAEEAADSLGLVLLANTGINSGAAIQALAILDSIDQEKYTTALDLTAQLHAPAYPIKSRWLAAEELLFGGEMSNEEEEVGYWNQDSLRTHPDCQHRLNLVQTQAQQLPALTASVSVPNSNDYTKWEIITDYEHILGLLDLGKSGSALYHALKLKQSFPNDAFLSLLVGRSLRQIYAASLDHRFSSEVPTPRSRPDEDWQELMRMLRKMRTSELAKLAQNYLQYQQTLYPEYLPLAEELAQLEDLIPERH